jgi:hypothetical protein
MLLTKTSDSLFQFFCQTCPYVCPVEQKIVKDVKLTKKKHIRDDVITQVGNNATEGNSQIIRSFSSKLPL